MLNCKCKSHVLTDLAPARRPARAAHAISTNDANARAPDVPYFERRHALLFRDRFNFTGLDAAVTPALLEQICSTPGALSQVFGTTHLVLPLKLTGSGSGWCGWSRC